MFSPFLDHIILRSHKTRRKLKRFQTFLRNSRRGKKVEAQTQRSTPIKSRRRKNSNHEKRGRSKIRARTALIKLFITDFWAGRRLHTSPVRPRWWTYSGGRSSRLLPSGAGTAAVGEWLADLADGCGHRPSGYGRANVPGTPGRAPDVTWIEERKKENRFDWFIQKITGEATECYNVFKEKRE
jgi:hypothetical protein